METRGAMEVRVELVDASDSDPKCTLWCDTTAAYVLTRRRRRWYACEQHLLECVNDALVPREYPVILEPLYPYGTPVLVTPELE